MAVIELISSHEVCAELDTRTRRVTLRSVLGPKVSLPLNDLMRMTTNALGSLVGMVEAAERKPDDVQNPQV